jgi:hypothetical protein
MVLVYIIYANVKGDILMGSMLPYNPYIYMYDTWILWDLPVMKKAPRGVFGWSWIGHGGYPEKDSSPV